jgi:hypothetical protein
LKTRRFQLLSSIETALRLLPKTAKAVTLLWRQSHRVRLQKMEMLFVLTNAAVFLAAYHLQIRVRNEHVTGRLRETEFDAAEEAIFAF